MEKEERCVMIKIENAFKTSEAYNQNCNECIKKHKNLSTPQSYNFHVDKYVCFARKVLSNNVYNIKILFYRILAYLTVH